VRRTTHAARERELSIAADTVVTPEMFAQTIVDDYQLAQTIHPVIVKSIQDQLSDFKAHSGSGADGAEDAPADAVPRRGKLEDNDSAWWDAWRKGAHQRERLAVGKQAPRDRKRRKFAPADDEVPLDLDGFEFDDRAAEEEMRIVIKVG
jgi:SWI/SNF-related matrix-associated actin-dependent regulator of chromatin subfamily B protein 1